MTTSDPSPTSAAQEEWWDHSLTSAGRGDFLKAAGLKLPAKVLWHHMSPEARAAVDPMRPSEFRPEDRIAQEATGEYFSCLQCTPLETLRQIADRLTTTTPAEIIKQMIPVTQAGAMTWARRLPLWDEHRNQYPGPVIALARCISRRAMKEFGLVFDAEGRVVQEKAGPRCNDKPTSTFPMRIGEQAVQVSYTRHYFPHSGTDLFSFIGALAAPSSEPDTLDAVLHAHRPHPLSDTGWHSRFVSHDAVEACGGPEKYAALYAEAALQGKANEFIAAFEGERPEAEKTQRRSPRSPKVEDSPPVIGEHTAAVVEEKIGPEKPKQGMLF